MRTLILIAIMACMSPPSAVLANDVGPPTTPRTKHAPSPVNRAMLIPSICSPMDERQGLCRWTVIERDPIERPLPVSAEDHNSRALTFMAFGLTSAAFNEFAAAIEKRPDYAEAYNNRGTLYAAIRDVPRALSDYNRALLLKPGYPDPFFNRAQLYKNTGKYEEAIRDYTAYLALMPGDVDGYINRAFAYRQTRDYKHALADLDQVVRARPRDADAYNARCWARAVAGIDLAKALADCNKSLRLSRTCAALDSRGFVRFRMGDMRRAIADNTDALKIKPDLASAMYVRGLARLRLGDRVRGEADITAAEALDPTLPATYGRYGIEP
jgi:tetratricopeptide (TPR) repeat protein